MRAAIDYFVPSHVLGDGSPDELRRARLTVVLGLALTINALPNVPLLLEQSGPEAAGMVALSALLSLLTAWVQRWFGSVRAAGHWLVFTTWLGMFLATLMTGGIESPGAPWLGVPVIFAMMLLGKRAGTAWAAFLICQPLTYLVIHRMGFDIPFEARLADKSIGVTAVLTTLFVAIFLLVWLYEDLKRRMLSEIDSSKAAVERAHHAARAVLDNVGQGLLMVDRHGTMDGQCSRAVAAWFGVMNANQTVASYFARVDRRFAEWLEMGWEDIFSNVLPLEVVLGQMPGTFEVGTRRYSVEYRPIAVNGECVSILLVISDVTALRAAQAAEEHQREQLSAMQKIVSDRWLFLEFLSESRRRIQRLGEGSRGAMEEMRELHTLKGNAGMFGFTASARYCHELETKLALESRSLDRQEHADLLAHWEELEHRLQPLLGETEGRIVLIMEEYRKAIQALPANETGQSLTALMRAWVYEPTRKRLLMFADQAKSLARQLGKGEITVQVVDSGLRLPTRDLSDFWSNLAHVVRNSVDHGLESPQERESAGKPPVGELRLVTVLDGDCVRVEISDDGAGVDWDRVKGKARSLGLACDTPQALHEALFADGITTRSQVTEVSGRGVGLAAVKNAVVALGGQARIESTMGRGTKFIFMLPYSRVRPSVAPGASAA